MEQADFVIWDAAADPGVCSVVKIINFDKPYLLDDGKPLAADFPGDVGLLMDPDTPEDSLLADNLLNPMALIVVSAKLKQLLEERGLQKTEYLPVAIIDHRNRPVDEPYFIVHPINHVQCLDVDASGGEWDLIDDTVLESVERVVLDTPRLEQGRELFRPFPLTDIVVVSRELADTIDTADISGCEWLELSEYSTY
ncbi:MAG: hypothetical protein KJO55_03890 [Gammaproteobacteria bacterium]|nr:hypothetical protein [Gammaproteobacteria bacterium]